MKSWFLVFITLALTACAAPVAPTAPSAAPRYPDLGAAPEMAGDSWLNAPSPLRLSDLRGKVVLVDMWTFG
jgi:hypothetical protein